MVKGVENSGRRPVHQGMRIINRGVLSSSFRDALMGDVRGKVYGSDVHPKIGTNFAISPPANCESD